MSKVLLVDDDVELVDMLKEYLSIEGFAVDTAYSGEVGLARAISGEYSLVVLDVMMPPMSGIEVLKHLRQRSSLPVLMLTAKGDDASRITGLELGADDYVPKPCTARELTARIRAHSAPHRSDGRGQSGGDPGRGSAPLAGATQGPVAGRSPQSHQHGIQFAGGPGPGGGAHCQQKKSLGSGPGAAPE